MDSPLTHSLATTDALAQIFADTSVIREMLGVEAALARVEARLGVIPAAAGEIITRAADAVDIDAADLARKARQSGTLAIPLVAMLTERVRAIDANAATFVHWGATSQDVVDTALVRLIGRSAVVIARDYEGLHNALRALSDRHAGDVMLGRTLLQPATPITFGLKVAGWLGGISRSWSQLDTACQAASVLQFGGASGTLAALDDRGISVADGLAHELHLYCPDAPWHTQRDRLAGVVCACAVFTGALGKMARDISLLMQAEVGEAAEPGGGSSTMPHKRNPVGCAIALASASRLPGLASTLLAGQVQEHERSAGLWHAEWPTIADAIQATGAAAAAMHGVADGLTVDPARMRANLDATNGSILAERVVMRSAAALGRDRARAGVQAALARSAATGETFSAVLRTTPEFASALSDDDLQAIDRPEQYLGSAETLRRRLLDSAAAVRRDRPSGSSIPNRHPGDMKA